MVKEISFLYLLSPDLNDRLRVNASKEKGRIVGFIVQNEAFIRGKWHPIVRYDSSHGFAHKDIIHYNGETEKQPLNFANYNIAFTFAIQDLKLLWQWYRCGFEKEID